MSHSPQFKTELLQAIKEASEKSNKTYLTIREFKASTGISMRRILSFFDSWTEACIEAGVKPGEVSPNNITPKVSKGKSHALAEVKRISAILGTNSLSQSQYNSQFPKVKAITVARLWGGWDKALDAAGLEKHPQFYDEIPLTELAKEFLFVFHELKKVPTLIQLSRRSTHGQYCFSEKFGGYPTFKIKAIKYLLSNENLPDGERLFFEKYLKGLLSQNSDETDIQPHPHVKGRHLGFRAFAFAPTYETEVVSLFACVADELGFEIVAQRAAFPDCEARRLVYSHRKRYQKCLIEFEYKSSDYRKHKHPLKGCDLIVCWEHNWKDCPLEVLELKSRIRKLSGWK